MIRKRCLRILNARKLHRNSQLHKKKSSTKTDENRTVTVNQKTRDAAGTGFFRGAWPALSVWQLGRRKPGHDPLRHGRIIITADQRENSLYKATSLIP